MRLCVIGNSQCAALRTGEAPAGVHPTYFAAPRQQLAGLRPVDGRLVADDDALRQAMARTSGGLDVIEPDAYDAFAVVGMTGVLRIVSDFSSPHRTLEDAVDPQTPLISEGCFRAAIRGHLHAGVAVATIAKLRAVTGHPVVLVPAPLPTAASTRDPHLAASWREPRFARHVRAALDLELAALEVLTVTQPERTIEQGIFTRSELASGAHRLDATTPFDRLDTVHMNGEYGTLMLERIVAAIVGDQVSAAAGVHSIARRRPSS